MTRLVLIRHGEAQTAVDQIVGGHEGCTGLSKRGIQQAEALRDRLLATGELEADVLLSSVLPRAVQTAEILSPAFGGLEPDQHCDLCEQHPGECDGISWDAFRERYQTEPWSPFRAAAPGGESWAEFMVRAGRSLNRVVRDHEGSTVVVACHGGIIMGSLVAGLRLPVTEWPPVDIENTSLTEWRIDDDGWRLMRFNDTAHLADLD